MKQLFGLFIAAAMTGPVYAQPAPPAARASVSPQIGVDQRIEQMRQRLSITPSQQPAWEAFTRTMRDNATAADQAFKERAASISTMSAPDNMRNFAQLELARAQGVQNLAASFQTLYDAFSDEQKRTADAMFRHYQDRAAAAKGK